MNPSKTKLSIEELKTIETFLSDESKHPQEGIFGTLPNKAKILNLLAHPELDEEMLVIFLACHMDDFVKMSGLEIDLMHPIPNAKSLLTFLKEKW